RGDTAAFRGQSTGIAHPSPRYVVLSGPTTAVLSVGREKFVGIPPAAGGSRERRYADAGAASPSYTAARTPRRASSARNGSGSATSAKPAAPARTPARLP